MKGRKIPDTITEQDFLMIDKSTKKLKLKLAFRLGFYECMRVSEVLNLTKEDVNTQTGFIHIKQGKGNKDRDIPLFEELKHYIRYLPIEMTRQGLNKAIRTKANKILNKPVHFHTLRHSGASMYLNEQGVGIKYIQDLLGHEKLSTTEIYLHTNPIQLKRAFENTSRLTQKETKINAFNT